MSGRLPQHRPEAAIGVSGAWATMRAVFQHAPMNESMPDALARNVRDALSEDIGIGDWTARLIPAGTRLHARLVAKESGLLCGRAWFDACFLALDGDATLDWSALDGDAVQPGRVLCHVQAESRALLSAERSALNFVQMLSGVATRTQRYVQAIAGASPNPRGCLVLDTRKTLPGLRHAQKYAVRVGGGRNQRLALWDGILIKENHIAAAAGIGPALRAARHLDAGVGVQIEVESLAELEEALREGATSVLLDDFTLADMHRAVGINSARALLEVSGSVTLENVREIARTGVDRISVGDLTKNVRALDLSLRVGSPNARE